MRALPIRSIVLATIICVMCASSVSPALAMSVQPSFSTPAVAEPEIDPRVLREQLTKGLRVTRPEEEAFIDKVVYKVDKGDLELRLVYAIFNWSRRRKPHYPFPYFKEGMIRMAKKEGVDLSD